MAYFVHRTFRMPKQGPADDLQEMARELMSDLEILTRRFILPKSAHLSRSETVLLQFLSDRGRATMSDISAHLGLALSSTTGVVDGLVSRSLVERARPEHDRRTVLVEMTPRGRRMHQEYAADRISLAMGMLEPLSESERHKFLALFRKMVRQGG